MAALPGEASVDSKIADAESALLVSKQCQQNGLLAEVSIEL